MKKIFITLLLACLGVVLVGLGKAPAMIADYVSKKLGVPVELGTLKVEQKQVTAGQIKIGNPPGSVQDVAFKGESLTIIAPLSAYFQNNIVIDQINVDGIYLDLEFNDPKSKEGNWSEIMGRANQQAGIKEEDTKPDPSKGTVLIHKLVLTNISTDLIYKDQGKEVKHLPQIDKIELTELSGQGGPDEILRLVIGNMLKSVGEQQKLGHQLPGGHLRYLLPLKRIKEAT